jgi:selenocysteine lyase/cysteine desulfurase
MLAMNTRRGFLHQVMYGGAGAVAGMVAFADDAMARIAAASAAVSNRTPEEVAADEDYWREIQGAFTLDRTLINLNNGGCCPSPRVVHEAFKRYLDISNQTPVYHMWQIVDPGIETVRRRLAAHFGCDVEEMAITRNASEALQIAQLGLDLAPGAEVVTTVHDYPRMLDTWEQRVARDRIVLTRVQVPAPPGQLSELTALIEKAITPKTKVVHISHVTFSTGQIYPVGEICRMARARGIRTIVDGAHAFAHFPFKAADLDCDYYGCSLHKWLLAPVGTGFLYVRRELIENHWPLTATSLARKKDIRKFEEIGTHPAANHNAIAEALTFLEGIGHERKAARLRYLRDRWAKRIEKLPRVRFYTSLRPEQSCGLATVGIDGTDPAKIVEHCWSKYRLIVVPINYGNNVTGIRVTPNVYTTLAEVDLFGDIMERIAIKGLA